MSRFVVTMFFGLLMLSGCSGQSTAPVHNNSALKLYVFDCGGLRFDSVTGFSIKDAETDIREFSVPCYVIEHPKGPLLWDGGLPSKTAEIKGWHGKGMLSRPDTTLAQLFPSIGLDMTSFDYVAFSHMHFDHVGVANEVLNATLLIQQYEYDAAFADRQYHRNGC